MRKPYVQQFTFVPGYTLDGDKIVCGASEFAHWTIVHGRPHRHEFGEFILRWALAGCPSGTLLLTGPSDRPVGPFLKANGIEWHQVETLNSLAIRPAIQYSSRLGLPIPSLGEPDVERHDLLKLGTALLEEDMEVFLFSNPARLSEALGEAVTMTDLSRQFSIEGGRPDIVATDSDNKTCTIECKRGPLRRSYVGQLIEYFRPEHPTLADSRLILLLNSANPEVISAIRRVGIEIRVLSYAQLVDAMQTDGFHPQQRASFSGSSGMMSLNEEVPGLNEWKANFLSQLRVMIPEETQGTLLVKADYAHAKKIRLSRLDDDHTVLYVASNAGRLEFGHPILHHFLASGVPIEVMKTKGPSVFLSKRGRIANISIEVKADQALAWLSAHQDIFIHAIEHYAEGDSSEIEMAVLKHLGATIQDSNASKLRADGVCQSGPDCPYCRGF